MGSDPKYWKGTRGLFIHFVNANLIGTRGTWWQRVWKAAKRIIVRKYFPKRSADDKLLRPGLSTFDFFISPLCCAVWVFVFGGLSGWNYCTFRWLITRHTKQGNACVAARLAVFYAPISDMYLLVWLGSSLPCRCVLLA